MILIIDHKYIYMLTIERTNTKHVEDNIIKCPCIKIKYLTKKLMPHDKQYTRQEYSLLSKKIYISTKTR